MSNYLIRGHAAKFSKLVNVNEIQSKAKIPHLNYLSWAGNQKIQ